MSPVNMQTRRWCGQDHATVSEESSTSSDRQQRRPDVRRNSVDMTAQPADDTDRQQNADVALMFDAVAETGTHFNAVSSQVGLLRTAVPFRQRRVIGSSTKAHKMTTKTHFEILRKRMKRSTQKRMEKVYKNASI